MFQLTMQFKIHTVLFITLIILILQHKRSLKTFLCLNLLSHFRFYKTFSFLPHLFVFQYVIVERQTLQSKVLLIGGHVQHAFMPSSLTPFSINKLQCVLYKKTWKKCPLVPSLSESWDFSLNTCLSNVRWIQYQTGGFSHTVQWITPSWMHYEDEDGWGQGLRANVFVIRPTRSLVGVLSWAYLSS